MAYLDDTGVTTLTSEIKSHVDERYLTNASITSVYSTSSAYSIGDYCLKDGLLYRCITPISSPGEPWDSSHWVETSVLNEVKRNNFTNNLLWTNPDPTAAFAAQTLSIDLSGYTFIKICFLWYNGDSTNPDINKRFYQDFEIGYVSHAFRLEVSLTETKAYPGDRRIEVLSNSIIFEDCRQLNLSGSTSSTYSNTNGAIVPYKIYGIV